MSGEQPSNLQRKASQAQSAADRGAASKEQAGRQQAEADRRAMKKH